MLDRATTSICSLDQVAGRYGPMRGIGFCKPFDGSRCPCGMPVILAAEAEVLALRRLADCDLFAIHLHFHSLETVRISFLFHGREAEDPEVAEIQAQ